MELSGFGVGRLLMIVFLKEFQSTLICSGDFGVDIELKNSGYLSCALAIEEGREFVVIGGYRHQHTDRYLASSHTHHPPLSRYAKNGAYLGALPKLREPRWSHGCSVFTNVTGAVSISLFSLTIALVKKNLFNKFFV